MKYPAVYIISNYKRTTLYIGVTNNLERRMLEHKAGIGSVFASQYQLTDLVHFEKFENMTDAIRREKQLKNWHAEWKWNLVRETNKDLADLAFDWFSVNEIEQFRIDMESEYL